MMTRAKVSPPERRHLLGTWWVGTGAKVAGAAYWFPGEQAVKELCGTRVSTVATTSSEFDDESSVTWLDTCGYSDEFKQGLEREVSRIHRGLRDARTELEKFRRRTP